jgi:hypothetical protein
MNGEEASSVNKAKKKKRSGKKSSQKAQLLYQGSAFFDIVGEESDEGSSGRRALARSGVAALDAPGVLVLSEHPYAFVVTSANMGNHCAACCSAIGGANNSGSRANCGHRSFPSIPQV